MSKRLGTTVLVTVLMLAAAAPAGAQVDAVAVEDAVDTACKASYLDGSQCQGPDRLAEANGCSIRSWVGRATCELTVADGVADGLNLTYGTRAELNVAPQYAITVRDESGAILHSQSGSGGVQVGLPGSVSNLHLVPLWQTNWFSSGTAPLDEPVVTGTVTCEITGTHTRYGALHPDAHNVFGCIVD